MERNARLDAIRKHAEKFDAIAAGYRTLLRMAEQEETTDAFLALAEAAGNMTIASMDQLATTLEILQQAGVPAGSVPEDWRSRPVASDFDQSGRKYLREMRHLIPSIGQARLLVGASGEKILVTDSRTSQVNHE